MKSVIVLFFMSLTRNILGASYDTEWWKHTDIYELDVGGFKDHDGDGFGDLQGLISKVNYIKELGFRTIKLSPVCSSTDLIVSRYGIEDFRKIHLTIGIMQDFQELMKKTESEGIKVILDFMINDCSTSHEWFEMSRQRIDPYTDYFIWRDLTEEELKTGATSSSSWTMDYIRKQLYYSRENYFAKVADLNFRNELVKQEVKELIKFWLDKGVAGLNLLGANQYIEDPLIMKRMYPQPILTQNYPESYEFIHELREFVDEYSKQKGDYQRILIVENIPNEKYDNLRGNETYPIAHIVSSDVMQQIIYKMSPPYRFYGWWSILYSSNENLDLLKHITEEVKNGPSLFISESAESETRLGSKFKDPQLLNPWIMSMAMCPGVFHMFYGQEIGLQNFHSRNRDFTINYPYGSSMHWDDSINAGFTRSNFAIVPPNVNYWAVNVEKHKNEKFSTFHMVKDLLKLRRTEAVIYGDLKTHNITEFVFAFTRSYEDKESYFTIFNFANVPYSVSLNSILDHLPNRVSVAAATPNASYQKGDELATESPLQLRPASGMVLDVINKRKR